MPSGVMPSPSIGSVTGLRPDGQTLLHGNKGGSQYRQREIEDWVEE